MQKRCDFSRPRRSNGRTCTCVWQFGHLVDPCKKQADTEVNRLVNTRTPREDTEWWYLCGRVRARFGLTWKSISWSRATCVLQGSANLQTQVRPMRLANRTWPLRTGSSSTGVQVWASVSENPNQKPAERVIKKKHICFENTPRRSPAIHIWCRITACHWRWGPAECQRSHVLSVHDFLYTVGNITVYNQW